MDTEHIENEQTDKQVSAFRRFNRLYTRFIGTLQEGLLDTQYSLSEARVLYEVANRQQPLAKEIVAELGMDAGYVSRILRKFEQDGQLKRAASPEDGRQAHLMLTRKGQTTFRDLNARSDRQARSILDAIPSPQRRNLIQSMRTIEAILDRRDTPDDPKPFLLRAHRPGDMGWVVHREGTLYAQEYGWDNTFEVLAARIVADFIDHFDPACERCWIAERDGENLGHIFLVKHPEQAKVAKLRLLLVEPAARGLGVGNALVSECIRFARDAGYQRITLWTQSILTAAHRIYHRAGFQLVREEPHHNFGKDLIGQTWELELHQTG